MFKNRTIDQTNQTLNNLLFYKQLGDVF